MGKVLGLIPAKAASTRLKKKNLRKLGGKSLLEWAILSGQKSGVLDDVLVSTESEEIASAAKAVGASAPFLRPEKLAVDPAGVVDVALHAVDEMAKLGNHYETLVILLPTSPFRTAADISASMQRYRNGCEDFLMSVSEFSHTPLAAHQLDNSGQITPLHPEWLEKLGARAQQSTPPQLVRANGAVAIVDIKKLQETRTYYSYPLAAYAMPWNRSLDIDTDLDMQFAEFLVQSGIAELPK